MQKTADNFCRDQLILDLHITADIMDSERQYIMSMIKLLKGQGHKIFDLGFLSMEPFLAPEHRFNRVIRNLRLI